MKTRNKRFNELLGELRELHDAKNHDYAGDDPLSNLKVCEKAGVPAWIGVVVRLGDKFSRLQNFARTGILKVKSEGIKDTFRDIIVYCLLAIILLEEKEDANAQD